MKKPSEMTEQEIRDEIFSDDASAAREKALMEELVTRGAAKRTTRQPDVTDGNEER